MLYKRKRPIQSGAVPNAKSLGEDIELNQHIAAYNLYSDLGLHDCVLGFFNFFLQSSDTNIMKTNHMPGIAQGSGSKLLNNFVKYPIHYATYSSNFNC